MFEPRVYRAAFMPALLALVLTMFSLQSRPAPLPQGLAADVLFDGRVAAAETARIVAAAPDRRPGGAGTAHRRAGRRRARVRAASRVEPQRFSHAGRELVNVIGRRAGRSRRQIVIVADRDAATVPDATGSASDTAALIELARVLEGRATRKTLVLASLDGSTLGEVGARAARRAARPGPGRRRCSRSPTSPRRPAAARSSRRGRPTSGARASASSARWRSRSGASSTRCPAAPASFGQLARLSFPIGIGPQGVLLEHGYDAVRIAGSGELPPGGNGPVEAIDEDKLGALGRATLRTITALDRGPRPSTGPTAT